MVHARQDRDALGERDERHGVGADVARVDAPEGEEPAVAVERELRVRHEVAGVVIGEERLASLARPLHGPAQALRRPRDQRELGIERVARTVVAADLPRHHAHRALRHAERRREVALDAHRAAGARVERVAAARLIEDGDRGTRLHRHARDPLHPRLEPHHVGGAGECGVGGRGIARVGVDAHVRGGFLPAARGARGGRLDGDGDRG